MIMNSKMMRMMMIMIMTMTMMMRGRPNRRDTYLVSGEKREVLIGAYQFQYIYSRVG